MDAVSYRFARGVRAQAEVQYRLACAAEKWNSLHLTQSQMDGACGLHALCMGLMVLTGLPRRQFERLAHARKGPLHALWKVAQSSVFEGVDAEDVVEYVRAFAPALTAKVVLSSSGKRIARHVDAAISAGHMPLLWIDGRTWSHFCLVIGVEQRGATPTALLTLDSSHPAPRIAPFNGRLDFCRPTERSVRITKDYPWVYRYVGGQAWAVDLGGLVIVRRTKKPP